MTADKSDDSDRWDSMDILESARGMAVEKTELALLLRLELVQDLDGLEPGAVSMVFLGDPPVTCSSPLCCKGGVALIALDRWRVVTAVVVASILVGPESETVELGMRSKSRSKTSSWTSPSHVPDRALSFSSWSWCCGENVGEGGSEDMLMVLLALDLTDRLRRGR